MVNNTLVRKVRRALVSTLLAAALIGGVTVVGPFGHDVAQAAEVATKATLTNPSDALPVAVLGEAYSEYKFEYTGYPAPTFSTNRSLPAGMTLSKDGVLSGVPSGAPAKVLLAVYLSNSKGITTYSIPLTVRYAGTVPVLTEGGAMPEGLVGNAYSYGATATASPSPTFSASNLPNGLVINPSTGLITGTPKQAFDDSITISATNHVGTSSVVKHLSVVQNASAYSQGFDAKGYFPEWQLKRSQDNDFMDVQQFIQNRTTGYLFNTGKGTDYELTMRFAPGVYKINAETYQSKITGSWTITAGDDVLVTPVAAANKFVPQEMTFEVSQYGNESIHFVFPTQKPTDGYAFSLDNVTVNKVG
jgi:hypothetical protein